MGNKWLDKMLQITEGKSPADKLTDGLIFSKGKSNKWISFHLIKLIDTIAEGDACKSLTNFIVIELERVADVEITTAEKAQIWTALNNARSDHKQSSNERCPYKVQYLHHAWNYMVDSWGFIKSNHRQWPNDHPSYEAHHRLVGDSHIEHPKNRTYSQEK